MHVELTEKELLSCGLPMYVCSLHEKECPCRLGVRSSGDCFDIQFLLLSAAALQSEWPIG